jgi:hypothetical protein
MVPMHLGLIDRPLVPHNLISTQESPAPLSNSQMAADNLFAFWVQQRNPDIPSLFSQKSWQMKSIQVPQQGPLWRDIWLQVIVTCLKTCKNFFL